MPVALLICPPAGGLSRGLMCNPVPGLWFHTGYLTYNSGLFPEAGPLLDVLEDQKSGQAVTDPGAPASLDINSFNNIMFQNQTVSVHEQIQFCL